MPPRTCFLQVNTAFWQPVYSWDPWASLPDWISLRQSFLGGFYPAYRWNSHARAKQWRNLSAALKECSSSLTGFSYPAGWPAALQKSEVIRNKAEMLKQIPHPRFHRTQAPGSPFLQLSLLRDLPLCSLVYTCTRRKWGREYSLLRTNHHLKSSKLISLTWLPEPELRRHPLTFSFQFRYLSKAGPVFVSEMPTCITKTALMGSSKAWILMTSALAAPTQRRKCFVVHMHHCLSPTHTCVFQESPPLLYTVDGDSTKLTGTAEPQLKVLSRQGGPGKPGTSRYLQHLNRASHPKGQNFSVGTRVSREVHPLQLRILDMVGD